MEVKGQLISSPTFNASAALFGEAVPQAKSERLRGLVDRQRALQEALSLKLQELRKVCLQEAELTGQLPPECPLEPGERPQLVRRRPPAARAYPPPHPNPAHHSLCPAEELALEALEREVSVQQQIAAAARRLALAPELSIEQRRRRRQVQADALRRLHELEEQLGDLRARLGLPVLPPPQPLPLSTGAVITAQGVCLGTRLAQLSQEDVVLHSESSSLSESGASHDNEEPRSCFPLAERPSPPKAWDQLRAVSGGSPERRTPWKPPPSDLYGDLKSRRNSVASPTSPTRSLPRSASSFEGRSVPATPVLTRGAGPQLCNAARTKPCGLPLEATEGPEVHPNPLLWMPPPTRIPPAGERSGHKNLALEGLRDWYIRNSGLAAGPQRRPVLPHMGPQHPPFLHARCYEVGQALYGAPSQAPLPHSRSFTAPPVSGRYYADFLYAPELSARLSDLTLEGEQSSNSDPQTPGTLV
ncbi:coiled-coil domain-containing protein 120 [Crocuta crocuta]